MRLDLSTEGYLTNPKTGELLLGYDGQPQRIAFDVASNQEFIKICDNVPSETSVPKFARLKSWLEALINTGKAVPVSGHGIWVKSSDLESIKGTQFDTDKVAALAKS